ncbi:MAG: hypothetical protein JST16_04950 [Bdellovibrionales bacterium]|nr:hypothetical protein [Bdellovibrionales bacterium]
MAKAHITTTDGTKVTIEGSHDEIVALIARLEGRSGSVERVEKTPTRLHKSKAKPTLVDLIAELTDGGFFKKPKELGAIRLALEEHGHFYPVTTLSPVLLRLVRKKELRRIKDNKRWLYVS